MRKTRLLATGMVGFWLWLAGLPVSHDMLGKWLAGEPPRAQAAEIGGTITADTTIDSATTVNPDLTVNPGVTLTIKAPLTGVAPNTNTLYNNGSILNLTTLFTNLNLVNNGNFTLGIPDDGGVIYATNDAVNWTNNGTMNIDNGFIYFHYNGSDGGNNIFDNSGAVIVNDTFTSNAILSSTTKMAARSSSTRSRRRSKALVWKPAVPF